MSSSMRKIKGKHLVCIVTMHFPDSMDITLLLYPRSKAASVESRLCFITVGTRCLPMIYLDQLTFFSLLWPVVTAQKTKTMTDRKYNSKCNSYVSLFSTHPLTASTSAAIISLYFQEWQKVLMFAHTCTQLLVITLIRSVQFTIYIFLPIIFFF